MTSTTSCDVCGKTVGIFQHGMLLGSLTDEARTKKAGRPQSYRPNMDLCEECARAAENFCLSRKSILQSSPTIAQTDHKTSGGD